MSDVVNNAAAASDRLRVAVCLDSLSAPAWIQRVLCELHGIARVDIAWLLLPDEGRPRRGPRRRSALIYRLWCKCDRAIFKVAPDAFQPVDCEGLLAHCRRLLLPAPASADWEAFRLACPDVVLHLGSFPLPKAVEKLPRLGVWRLQHGAYAAGDAEYAGGWEVLRHQAVTHSELQVLHSAEEGPRTLHGSAAATDRCSIVRNRNHCYWKAAEFISRKLRDCADALPSRQAPAAGDLRPPRDRRATPGNVAALLGIGRILSQSACSRFRQRWFRKQWFCAFGFSQGEAVNALDFSRFHHMLPPRDRFWADPFPVKLDDKYFLFFEEMVLSTGRGRIVVCEVNRDGGFSEPRVALERPYHLSYPYIFSWQDAWYMLPETAENRSLELWRCARWPNRWEFDRTLLDNVKAVDATIAEIDGRFWMFTCMGADGVMPYDELFVYWADGPLGPWHAHARNPVQSDARCARPAGRLFQRAGRWFRPAQDCTGRYGRRIVVQEIVRLTPDEYFERPAWSVEPTWSPGLIATHTLNFAEQLTVIDGCRWRWRGRI